MLVGFNYPWSREAYSSQIGPNIKTSPEEFAKFNSLELAGDMSMELPPLFEFMPNFIPDPPNSGLKLRFVERNLCNLKRMGIGVVRWFLLGNGNNYGPNPTLRTPTLPHPAAARYSFHPPNPIDKRFRRDFVKLLTIFREREMRIIPSLIDFAFGGEIMTGPGPPEGKTWWGGRADVIRDPVARSIFLDTMLAELLAASKEFKDQIYAWEVINEPIWLCIPTGPLSQPSWVSRVPETTISEMNLFLKEACRRIEAADFVSTVGHRYFGDLNVFEKGNKPQFHYYADFKWYNYLGGAKNDPPMEGLFRGVIKPFLGEFAAHNNTTDRDRWAQQNDTTFSRLKRLEEEGCELALIWPDVPGNRQDVKDQDILKLQIETRREIVKYTGGKLPDNEVTDGCRA
jgi:hypothetical protein